MLPQLLKFFDSFTVSTQEFWELSIRNGKENVLRIFFLSPQPINQPSYMISDSTFYRYTIVIDVFSNEINKTHLKMRPVWFDIFLSLWAKLEYTQTSGYILLFGRVHVNLRWPRLVWVKTLHTKNPPRGPTLHNRSGVHGIQWLPSKHPLLWLQDILRAQ